MVVLRKPVAETAMRERGWSELRLADELGKTPQTITNVFNGLGLSGPTIAAFLRVFPELTFADLFADSEAGAHVDPVAMATPEH